jgi:STE24 endopeptidase
MFTHIFFLILALLLMNSLPETSAPAVHSAWSAFGISLLLYIGLCSTFFFQYPFLKKLFKRKPSFILFIINIELLAYLSVYQYLLDAGRLFHRIPFMQNMHFPNILWELSLYLGGLGLFYALSFVKFYSYSISETRFYYAQRQLQLLIPFFLPFVIITLVLDIFNALVSSQVSAKTLEWMSASFSLFIAILLFIFLPYFLQKIWKCKPLPAGTLNNRLTMICQKSGFKHAGMKTWTVMHDQLTAGIMGVISPFRYVMFTERLLKELSTESIEAILAHEIGHNTHRHLLFYPFIVGGIIPLTGIFFYFFSAPLSYILTQEKGWPLSVAGNFFHTLKIFSFYALITLGYFRGMFGFFSRLFERQADLHVFKVGLPLESMINALEAVAYANGDYATPNWHHYSIKERVEFLKSCLLNPLLIERHHRKVKKALVIYFALFATALTFLLYLMINL